MNGDITLLVTPKTGTDRFGDSTYGPVRRIAGWTIVPRQGGNEDTAEGEIVIVGLTAYGPLDAKVGGEDRVRIDHPRWPGEYEIVGEPGQYESTVTPSGVCEIALRRFG